MIETGRKNLAREMFQQLIKASRTRHVSPTTLADVQIGIGDYDEAFLWLKRAVKERAPAIITFRVDPRFEQIRSKPRFAKLLQSLFVTTPLGD